MRHFLLLLTACMLPSIASATTFNDRTLFDAAITQSYTEDFESCGVDTVGVNGPLSASGQCGSLVAGFDVSSIVDTDSADLYIAGPGQSVNPTTAIGSNFPADDGLLIALGGVFGAFGLDLFQNFGGGSQSGSPVEFTISFFLGSSGLGFSTVFVASDDGTFFGFTGGPFDTVHILANVDSFEVIDNVTVGNAAAVVPLPASLPLLVGALALLGVGSRRRRAS